MFQKLLCIYAFPRCKQKYPNAIKLPLCYEDCIAVRQLFCYNDWILIEENKKKGIYYKSRGHFELPDCDTLPSYRKDPTSCSYGRLVEMDPEQVTCKS